MKPDLLLGSRMELGNKPNLIYSIWIIDLFFKGMQFYLGK